MYKFKKRNNSKNSMQHSPANSLDVSQPQRVVLSCLPRFQLIVESRQHEASSAPHLTTKPRTQNYFKIDHTYLFVLAAQRDHSQCHRAAPREPVRLHCILRRQQLCEERQQECQVVDSFPLLIICGIISEREVQRVVLDRVLNRRLMKEADDVGELGLAPEGAVEVCPDGIVTCCRRAPQEGFEVIERGCRGVFLTSGTIF